MVNLVASTLINMGVDVLGIKLSQDESVEDHEIVLSDKVSIQVSAYGDTYMSVSRDNGDGSFTCYPERLDFTMLAFDIRKALNTK